MGLSRLLSLLFFSIISFAHAQAKSFSYSLNFENNPYLNNSHLTIIQNTSYSLIHGNSQCEEFIEYHTRLNNDQTSSSLPVELSKNQVCQYKLFQASLSIGTNSLDIDSKSLKLEFDLYESNSYQEYRELSYSVDNNDEGVFPYFIEVIPNEFGDLKEVPSVSISLTQETVINIMYVSDSIN